MMRRKILLELVLLQDYITLRRTNMKIEIGSSKPEKYKEYWPGQYKVFSHFEYIAGVPQPLFVISTLKENGKPNLCLMELFFR